MSTTTLWDDNFSGYSPGPGHPTGWFDPGGDTAFVAFSTMTGSSQAPGFYEQTGQGLHLSGDQIYYIDTSTLAVQSIQMVWMSFNSVYDVSAFNVNLATFTGQYPGQGQNILSCVFNPDFTMSLTVNSTVGGPLGSFPIAVTTQQVLYQNVWQMWQLDIQTTEIALVGTTYLVVAGTLALEGTQIANGTATTGIIVDNLYTQQPIMNQYSFGGAPGANGYLANFTGIAGFPPPPFGTWPHPGTPDAYYTQSVAEWMGRPDTSVRQARVTQGVNELIKLPSSTVRQARMTQGVVEIVLRTVPSLGYWVCYEA